MSEARALSSEQIRGLRAELDNGTTPTVWFTASAVGVDPGRSGKVVSMEEPAEGEFLQVRPAGSKDVLSFSAAEVTLDKPARKRGESATAGKGTSRKGSGSAKAESSSSAETPRGTASRADGSRGSTSTSASTSRRTKGTDERGGTSSEGRNPEEAGTKRSTTSRGGTSTRSANRRPSGATVTLTAGTEGTWTVEVSNGKKRVLRPTEVPASAVGQAAKALHEDVAAAVEPLLEAEREHQRARVEQLQRELEEAQRRLEELS
ncbi:DUF6319 family protein [Actinopolyspora mortivallis]|uniref:Cell wall anchor protein n=1 Tax=Actinopolyspora mortivallis TaxID=33906 RepID=A0A2T0GVS7_ACTMO|nr:DUF6319 family protein [Actinopolyspora mortivallis]PRW63202.1 cell wall anchor protein [Actinopolyspora mortivallis]